MADWAIPAEEEQVVRELINKELIGAVCFSQAKDLLSQWISYGDSGAGFSIGFSKQRLVRWLDDEYGFSSKLLDCIYDDDTKCRELNNLIARVLDSYKHEVQIMGILERLGVSMQAEAKNAVFKNAGFKQEQECRIVINMGRESNDFVSGSTPEDEGGEHFFRPTYDYINRGGNITARRKLSFSDVDLEEMVKQVVIGPKNPMPEGKVNELVRHFSQEGDHHEETVIEVVKSSISLR